MSEPTEEFTDTSKMSDEELVASICETFAKHAREAFAGFKADPKLRGVRITTTMEISDHGHRHAHMDVDEARLVPASEGAGESLALVQLKAIH
jgi:hypothetical protein